MESRPFYDVVTVTIYAELNTTSHGLVELPYQSVRRMKCNGLVETIWFKQYDFRLDIISIE